MSLQFPIQDWAKNGVIYEVNIRQYTPEGTFANFKKHLQRIKNLGVRIIWFMPVQPIGIKNRKSTLGSYYSIRDYREINPEYGNFDEFKDLVVEIHKLGMYVIIDWVANHTAWDHVWIEEHPDFYRRNEQGEVFPALPEWEDVVALDYTNEQLQQKMIEEMAFWMEKADIDGFRCDMANLVPTEFWEKAREFLNKFPRLFMLAEAEEMSLTDKAFDVIYNWKTYHKFNSVANNTSSVNQLIELIDNQLSNFDKNISKLLFISNHDENSWNGSAITRLGHALEPIAVLAFMLPGTPLIYSGMEAGNCKRLPFFEKDNIDWKYDKMLPLFSRLCQIRNQTNIELWYGSENNFKIIDTSGYEDVMCFVRFSETEKIIVLVNISDKKKTLKIDLPNISGDFINMFTYQEVAVNESLETEITPWGFVVLGDKTFES